MPSRHRPTARCRPCPRRQVVALALAIALAVAPAGCISSPRSDGPPLAAELGPAVEWSGTYKPTAWERAADRAGEFGSDAWDATKFAIVAAVLAPVFLVTWVFGIGLPFGK
jgi:hypothetical protein